MLTEIRLENFKRFKSELVVPCARLNLLTGVNSKGKSTALQPLLLMHQALMSVGREAQALEAVPLNGDSVQIGSYRDLQHRDRRVDPVTISFEFKTGTLATTTKFVLAGSETEQRRLRVQRLEVEQWIDDAQQSSISFEGSTENPVAVRLDPGVEMVGGIAGSVRAELRSLRSVHHVGADRMGPQEFYPRLDVSGLVTVGVRGERCAEAMAWARRQQVRVLPRLVAPDAEEEAHLVVEQASAWLSYIFDGADVVLGEPYSTILTLEFNEDGSAHHYRPLNVGFGFSYVLPIVVAGLIARPEQIVVVENPEAHLHPMAQARLGEFLARVAAEGVQVFVESHSEHLLNAFRLAVRDDLVPANGLVVLFFSDGAPPLRRIPVTDDGGVEHWPEGFFDQRLKDFVKLFDR